MQLVEAKACHPSLLCHPERSEGSGPLDAEILSEAKDDRPSLQMPTNALDGGNKKIEYAILISGFLFMTS